jgi:hypothetical protein
MSHHHDPEGSSPHYGLFPALCPIWQKLFYNQHDKVGGLIAESSLLTKKY